MRLRTLTLVGLVAASLPLAAPTADAVARPRLDRLHSNVNRSAQPARSKADIAVATARAQIGKPYRWAGSGPNAFDCSGLAMFSWAAAGVSLPHSSRAQFASLPKIPLDQLRPGDLVFSGGRRRINHVGIYVGDGQMIHAPQTGRRVEIAPLRRNIVGAGRPA